MTEKSNLTLTEKTSKVWLTNHLKFYKWFGRKKQIKLAKKPFELRQKTISEIWQITQIKFERANHWNLTEKQIKFDRKNKTNLTDEIPSMFKKKIDEICLN